MAPPSSSPEKAFVRILIVGGGIAGLTLAVLLQRRGLDLVLVEAQEAWSRHGYGISLWPMGSRILKGIGLFPEFQQHAVPIEHYRVVDSRGRLIRSYDFKRLFGPSEMLSMIMRWELIELLAGALQEVDVRMGATATAISQTPDQVEVAFSGGGRERFDLVVGCDGIHSRTRRQVFGDVPLRSTGWGGWAWWVDPSIASQHVITEYWTPGRFFGLYPARNHLFCFLGLPNSRLGPDPNHPSAEYLRENLRRLGGEARGVLADPGSERDLFYWDFSDLDMKQWYSGRVILLGDACSAILPTAGIGASSAMESAAVLADELLRANAGDIPRMCELYRLRRWQRAHAFQRDSRRMAAIMFLKSRLLSFGRDLVLKSLSPEFEMRDFSRFLRRPI